MVVMVLKVRDDGIDGIIICIFIMSNIIISLTKWPDMYSHTSLGCHFGSRVLGLGSLFRSGVSTYTKAVFQPVLSPFA